MQNLKNIAEKIIQTAVGFYEKLVHVYWPAYFAWLTEKMSDTEPFAVLSGSVVLIFVMVIYVWFRNRNV